MNRASSTILWLGLIMILVQIARDWPQVKSLLFTGRSQQQGSKLGFKPGGKFGAGVPVYGGNPPHFGPPPPGVPNWFGL